MKANIIYSICLMKIALFMLLLTANKKMLIFEKQGWMKVLWRLHPDTNVGALI